MKNLGFILCAVLALSSPQAAPASESEEGCENDTERFAQVSISVSEVGLVASPAQVRIYLDENPKAVCWVVDGLQPKQTLHIDRKEGQPDLFPDAGREIVSPDSSADSGYPNEKGTWKYQLWVTATDDDKRLLELDPEIIIDKGKNGEYGQEG